VIRRGRDYPGPVRYVIKPERDWGRPHRRKPECYARRPSARSRASDLCAVHGSRESCLCREWVRI